ncbi:unnamed protein product [Heterobilharzia americana]|nr:unnamed protein product [Heterobilharzia americana]
MHKNFICVPCIPLSVIIGTYEIILHQEFVAGRELLLIFTFLQNDLLPTDIQLTTTAGYFHKEPIGEALFLVPMAFCTPFSAHAAFYYGEALLTTINTSTYNATPQKGDLMDSLKPRTESDKISGEVRLYCDLYQKLEVTAQYPLFLNMEMIKGIVRIKR